MSKSLEKLRKRLNELSTSIEGNVAFLYELDSVIRNDSYDLDNVDKYLELLTIVDFDKPYAIFRSRCDRSIYDKFKTRSEINGSYEISDENRLNCVNAAFTYTSLSDEDKIRFANDASNLICDKMLKEDRISILQSLLANKLKDRIMIDTDGRRLFYRKDGKVKTISGYDKSSFSKFLHIPVHSSMNPSDVEIVVERLINYSLVSQSDLNNNVIQFNDCYILDGVAYEGFYDKGFPRFTVNKSVWKAISTGKVTKQVKEVDDLILHLCNYDKDTELRIFDDFCLCLLNAKHYKARYHYSPRIVGKDGANGKSTLQSLFNRTFNGSDSSSVCVAFKVQSMDQRETVYKVANALVAIDGDSSSKIISEDAAANFKSVTTGDSIDGRALYHESENIEPVCLMIQFSNDFPKSSDKSAAYLRRMDLVECKYQLISEDSGGLGPNSHYARINLTDEWFERINSEEAAQYLIEKIAIRSQQIVKEKKIHPQSQHMKDSLNRYAHINNSALAFISDVGIEKIVGFSVVEVKRLYEDWCQENDLSVMRQKFIETLESKGLSRKTVRKNRLHPDSDSVMALDAGKATVCSWQYAKEDVNREYFDRLFESLKDSSDLKESSISDENSQFAMVVEFVNLISIDSIINHRVSEVKDRFLEFCKSRNVEISDRSLNSTLEDYFKLERKKIYASKIILPEDFDKSLRSKSFSAWVKSN